MTPYLERQVYSPQATAGRGIRSTVGQRFYGGLSQNATPTPIPLPVPKREWSGQRPQEAMYAVDPGLFSGVDGGPGEGPDMGGPNAVSTGMMSQGTADFVEGKVAAGFGFHKGEKGWEMSVPSFLQIPKVVKDPLTSIVHKGVQKAGGWLVDKAKNVIADIGLPGKQAQEFALDTTPVTNPQTGLPAGFIGTGTPSSGLTLGAHDLAADLSAPPTSGLADIGFSSMEGTGGGFGGGMGGGLGVSAPGGLADPYGGPN